MLRTLFYYFFFIYIFFFDAGLVDGNVAMEDILTMLNTVVKESGFDDLSKVVNLEELTTSAISTDHVMTALQLDKVLDAGGVTIEDLRQDNASKQSVSDAVKKLLHSTGKTNKKIRKVQINKSNSWLQCRFPNLLLY